MSRMTLIGFCAAAALVLGAGSASASSFGCWIPTAAVDLYCEEVEDEFGSELSEDVKNCEKQCKDILKGCKGVASAAEDCVQASIDAVIKADGRGCSDLEDKEDQKACKNDNKENSKEFRDFLKENADIAKDDCDECYEDCLDACNEIPL